MIKDGNDEKHRSDRAKTRLKDDASPAVSSLLILGKRKGQMAIVAQFLGKRLWGGRASLTHPPYQKYAGQGTAIGLKYALPDVDGLSRD